jgi:hypothetical protein
MLTAYRRLLAAAAFLSLIAAALSSPAVASSGPCLTIEGQTYCKAWSMDNHAIVKTEFVRSNETVDDWHRLVTVIHYKHVSSIKDVVTQYLAGVSQFMGPGARPQWVVPKNGPHADSVATRLVLSTPDGSYSEYEVVLLYVDSGKGGHAVVFSQRLPLPNNAIPTMAQYGHWLADMTAITFR